MRMSLESRRFHMLKMKFSGVSIHMNTLSSGAEKRAKLSGASLAMLLGEISPKMRTTTVMTAVATEAPASSPRCRMKSTVPMEERAMFTMLLPMSSVESSLSYCPARRSTSAARLSPRSASALTRARLRVEKAVSVAEKYAEKMTSTAMNIIVAKSSIECVDSSS